MNRRTALMGLGAAATGSGVVFGSGAFSTVEADRTVKISVADDTNASLGIEATDNASFIGTDNSGTGAVAEFNFSNINDQARISFGAEFILTNNGQNPVRVIIDEQQFEADTGTKAGFFPAVGAISTIDSGGTLTLGNGDQGDQGYGPGDNGTSGITLEPGAVLPVSGEINVNGATLDDSTDTSFTIFAVGDNDERYPTAGPASYVSSGNSDIPVYGDSDNSSVGESVSLITGDSVTIDEIYGEGTNPTLTT